MTATDQFQDLFAGKNLCLRLAQICQGVMSDSRMPCDSDFTIVFHDQVKVTIDQIKSVIAEFLQEHGWRLVEIKSIGYADTIDAMIARDESLTDAIGTLSCTLRIGRKLGSNFVKVTCIQM